VNNPAEPGWGERTLLLLQQKHVRKSKHSWSWMRAYWHFVSPQEEFSAIELVVLQYQGLE